MRTQDLLERRTRVVHDMRAITEAPTGDGGDLSVEQSTKFDGLKGELTTLEKSIERQSLIDEAERRMNGQHIAGSGDNRLDTELRSFSLRKAILTQVPGHNEDCGRERELSGEIARRAGRPFQGIAVPMSVFQEPLEKRVITTGLPAGGPGGNIIATDLLGGQYIDRLRSALVIRRLGARVLSGLTSNVDIPRLKTSASVGWVAENTALAPSDQEFEAVQLRPKHVGGIVEFSRNMLLQSSPDIETLIRGDFAAIIARAADAAAINGSGGDEPTGIMNTPDVATVSLALLSWTAVLQLIEAVEVEDGAGTAFLTNAQVVRALRSTPKVGGTDSAMIMEGADSLAGYPLAQTSLMPMVGSEPSTTGSIIFGNFADLLLGFWSEFDLLINPYEATSYSKGNVKVRGMATMDIAVRHPESFAFADDVDTAVPSV